MRFLSLIYSILLAPAVILADHSLLLLSKPLSNMHFKHFPLLFVIMFFAFVQRKGARLTPFMNVSTPNPGLARTTVSERFTAFSLYYSHMNSNLMLFSRSLIGRVPPSRPLFESPYGDLLQSSSPLVQSALPTDMHTSYFSIYPERRFFLPTGSTKPSTILGFRLNTNTSRLIFLSALHLAFAVLVRISKGTRIRTILRVLMRCVEVISRFIIDCLSSANPPPPRRRGTAVSLPSFPVQAYIDEIATTQEILRGLVQRRRRRTRPASLEELKERLVDQGKQN